MNNRKLIISAFLLMVLLIVGYGAVHVLHDSAEGVIKPVVVQPSVSTTLSQRMIITNQYARFSYPDKFTRLGSDKPVDPVLASYNFTKQQIGSWQIAITITRLNTGKLEDDGTYNYRHLTASRYAQEMRTIGTQPAVIFTDKDDTAFAKVGYLYHGNLDASISFLGGTPSTLGQLQADFDALIASWQWL